MRWCYGDEKFCVIQRHAYLWRRTYLRIEELLPWYQCDEEGDGSGRCVILKYELINHLDVNLSLLNCVGYLDVLIVLLIDYAIDSNSKNFFFLVTFKFGRFSCLIEVCLSEDLAIYPRWRTRGVSKALPLFLNEIHGESNMLKNVYIDVEELESSLLSMSLLSMEVSLSYQCN